MRNGTHPDSSNEDPASWFASLKLEGINDAVEFGIKNSAGEVPEIILQCLAIFR